MALHQCSDGITVGILANLVDGKNTEKEGEESKEDLMDISECHVVRLGKDRS